MGIEKILLKAMNSSKITIAFLLVAIILILFLYFENNTITINKITISSNRIPGQFNGYKIVHLSDLHGKSFGENQDKLVKKIKEAYPDLIVFTGDLVDSRRYNEKNSIGLMKQLTKIAPVYYVTGNHEWRSGRFFELQEALIENGVKVLLNSFDKIKRGKDTIHIIGIDDPSSDYEGHREDQITKDRIEFAMAGIEKENAFTILLSHRPEKFALYSLFAIDVIFTGHAHGGQVRLPLIGGLVAPHQGLFPKYTSGKYTKDSSVMVVSRGLGNSIFPQRIFNRPEIVVIKLLNK